MPTRIGPISAKEFTERLAKLCLPQPASTSLAPRILDPFTSALTRPVLQNQPLSTSPSLHDNKPTTLRPRRIGIAVSGGVDSMALVSLLARHYESVLNPTFENFTSAAATAQPKVQLHGFIVDHKLRDESTTESRYVAKQISKQGKL